MTRLLMPTSAVMLATLVLACSDDQATLMPSAPTGLPGAATTVLDAKHSVSVTTLSFRVAADRP